MHQYWYVDSKGNGQLFTNQISVSALYSRPQIPKLEGINGHRVPIGWGGRVDPVENKSLTTKEHNGNSLSLDDSDDWESHDHPANWPQLPKHTDSMSNGHNDNSLPPNDDDEWEWESKEQPAIWPQSSEQGDFVPLGSPTPFVQPINHAGMSALGQPLGWAPLAGHAGFPLQKQPFPMVQPINQSGMFAQGYPPALQPSSPHPYGFSAYGQHANWGGFGNPAGWGGQVNPMGWGGPGAPMGWGNFGGNGQPGILGGLLKVGKGTMNGIGIISSLIGVGKFLF